MMTEKAVSSDLAIPPGEYLEEVIASLGMSKDELARRMARPATKLSLIFKGEKAITAETALQLEKVVGVPAHIWLGLDSEYRLTLARQQEQEEEERLKNEIGLVSQYCYSELVKVGIVQAKTRPQDKVLELQRFFGVASLRAVPEVRRYQAAFRQGMSKRQCKSPEALVAWLRYGEIKAQGISCSPFDKASLRRVIGEIRSLTTNEPSEFSTRLVDTLAKVGIALVICPHFKGTGAHGATFRLSRDKVVLMITIRGAWADIFWFSLFHELGHIILHDRQEIIFENDGNDDPEFIQREKEADAFATDTLIQPAAFQKFVAGGDFREETIRVFSQTISIDPGIIVGRLQHDGHLKPQWHNGLRTRYAWSKPEN
ncbi:MAG: HigA family addiction module antitoxin [Syntrophales bacterium]